MSSWRQTAWILCACVALAGHAAVGALILRVADSSASAPATPMMIDLLPPEPITVPEPAFALTTPPQITPDPVPDVAVPTPDIKVPDPVMEALAGPPDFEVPAPPSDIRVPDPLMEALTGPPDIEVPDLRALANLSPPKRRPDRPRPKVEQQQPKPSRQQTQKSPDRVEPRRPQTQPAAGQPAVKAAGSAPGGVAKVSARAINDWQARVRQRVNAHMTGASVRGRNLTGTITIRMSGDGSVISAALGRGTGNARTDQELSRRAQSMPRRLPAPPDGRPRNLTIPFRLR
ncbi:TonB C-terminal domain-containing protein [Paracoccus pacificus]|uniref:TonB C-terminal domain-containing protein n=1 Tax=Paracoccus pacificus TaxID=1463598 RepID=A0ABW4RAR6_9RHOB